MKTDETNPRHWFLLAAERFNAAELVYTQVGLIRVTSCSFVASDLPVPQDAIREFILGGAEQSKLTTVYAVPLEFSYAA